MSDQDRDGPPMRARRRARVIETGERSGGAGGGGGGGAIALVLLLIVIAGLAWFLMRTGTTRTGSGVNLSVGSEGSAANASR